MDPKKPPELESLRHRIRSNLEAVRPFYPIRLVVITSLIALALGLGLVQSRWGLRADHHELGTVPLILPTIIQIGAGLLLATVAARGAIPGVKAQARQQILASGLAIGLFIAISLITASLANFQIPAGRELELGLFCFSLELALAAPAAASVSYVLYRGMPTHPVRSALTGGIAAGLLADACWRLICPYSALDHVATAHLTAMLAVVLVSAVTGLASSRSERIGGLG